MPTRLTSLAAVPESEPFRDGLGERNVAVRSATGDTMEALHLASDLANMPVFEQAVRERLEKLAGFEDPRFTVPIRLETGPLPFGGLVLVSRRPPGVRLSQVIDAVAASGTPFDLASLQDVALQLTVAACAFQRAVKEAAIGTLAPERVILTHDGQLVIHEFAFATAVEALNLTRDRVWRRFRVPVPQTAGRLRIERAADAMQVGMIVLALLLGRPFRDDEFPLKVQSALNEAMKAVSAGQDPIRVSGLRTWLMRALQLDPRMSYQSALELEEGLPVWIPPGSMPPTAHVHQDRPTASPRRDPAPDHASPMSPVDAVPIAAATPPRAGGWIYSESEPADEPWHRRLLVVVRGLRLGRFARAGAWLLAIVAVGLLVAFGYMRWLSAGGGVGMLVVESRPAGIRLAIDGEDRGPTPVEATLEAGAHRIEIRLGERRRVMPVTVGAGERLTVTLELRDMREMGQLEIRSDPTGAQLAIDGRAAGTTPALVDVRSGSHTVFVRKGDASLRHEILVQPGRTASLLVALEQGRHKDSSKR